MWSLGLSSITGLCSLPAVRGDLPPACRREVHQDSSRVVVDGTYSAQVLIGADGANATVRRPVGQPPNRGYLAVAVRGYAPALDGFDGLYLCGDP